jgi:hypothetical protein
MQSANFDDIEYRMKYRLAIIGDSFMASLAAFALKDLAVVELWTMNSTTRYVWNDLQMYSYTLADLNFLTRCTDYPLWAAPLFIGLPVEKQAWGSSVQLGSPSWFGFYNVLQSFLKRLQQTPDQPIDHADESEAAWLSLISHLLLLTEDDLRCYSSRFLMHWLELFLSTQLTSISLQSMQEKLSPLLEGVVHYDRWPDRIERHQAGVVLDSHHYDALLILDKRVAQGIKSLLPAEALWLKESRYCWRFFHVEQNQRQELKTQFFIGKETLERVIIPQQHRLTLSTNEHAQALRVALELWPSDWRAVQSQGLSVALSQHTLYGVHFYPFSLPFFLRQLTDIRHHYRLLSQK